ncbi:MAG: hypothetical protein CMB48_05730, partial [Euryarchaeota archaeon]|nr:hypothetical protein [Euryarchaeota archaeon]
MKVKPIMLCLMMISISFAGCLGGETTSSSTTNQLPSISAEIWLADDDLLTDDGDGTWTLHIYLDWNISDSDGSIASLGIDTDNNGTIDFPLFPNVGVLTQEVAEIEPGEYANGSIPVPLEAGNTFFRSEDFADYGCALIWSKRITVIAIDDLGATSSKQVVLNDYIPSILHYDIVSQQGVSTAYGISATDLAWISSADCIRSIESENEGSENEYRAEDHPSATTSGMTDNLLRLSFVNGPDDLTWSFLTITLFDEE